MPDAASLQPMIVEHLNTFQVPIESIATDKAYYAKENEQMLLNFKVKDIALHRPNRKLNNAPNNPIMLERHQELVNRRSRTEPIISHLKKWQLGRSRMKSDTTTEASGYASMLGFNLHQLKNCLAKTPLPT